MGYALINPEFYEIATAECTLCNVTIHHPSTEDLRAFRVEHAHGNETLERWADQA